MHGEFCLAGVKGSREEVSPPPTLLFEKRGSVANHTRCWKMTLRRTKAEEGRWRPGKKKRSRNEKVSGGGTRGGIGVSYLIVDIEHPLLDLLVDLLGCVDKSLRETWRQRGEEIHIFVTTQLWQKSFYKSDVITM